MEVLPSSGSAPDGWRKGQVNVAQSFKRPEMDIQCGMVKDDNHRTRGLYYNNDEIYFPKKERSIPAGHKDSG